jgi:hypothetical protein
LTQSEHEQAVNAYYDIHTKGFYLEGWHPEHIHFGIFGEAKDAFYRDPSHCRRAGGQAAMAFGGGVRMLDLAGRHRARDRYAGHRRRCRALLTRAAAPGADSSRWRLWQAGRFAGKLTLADPPHCAPEG